MTSEDWFGSQTGNPNKEIKDEIIETALAHHIMTQYTSFVAVEEKTVTKGGKAVPVTVPAVRPSSFKISVAAAVPDAAVTRLFRALALATLMLTELPEAVATETPESPCSADCN